MARLHQPAPGIPSGRITSALCWLMVGAPLLLVAVTVAGGLGWL